MRIILLIVIFILFSCDRKETQETYHLDDERKNYSTFSEDHQKLEDLRIPLKNIFLKLETIKETPFKIVNSYLTEDSIYIVTKNWDSITIVGRDEKHYVVSESGNKQKVLKIENKFDLDNLYSIPFSSDFSKSNKQSHSWLKIRFTFIKKDTIKNHYFFNFTKNEFDSVSIALKTFVSEYDTLVEKTINNYKEKKIQDILEVNGLKRKDLNATLN